ncbi:6-phosphogluconate dehydrogenase [Paenibacillus sp. FSL R5-0345]|uniref:6-phosphogluconate dehydrogenase n=1 Tax=Paenibacillus odorifer TaxID=189426 RepID=A0A1R0Y5C8_9BACL|nr:MULTISPECIES: NAD(P)-dependent oxidoreductase [Paenibacillus]AIQ34076.1 6-phosphogluconate dehydrogenase [Paenibacillus sp. FSL R5-0345]OMD42535.1 6-phosphogluconate dehydrogenase [Paenibacillus odorifer]
MKISFIGLGKMGFPMAQNLLKAGNELIVFNRTREKAQPLIDQGAHYAETPLEAAKNSDMVITMLSDDAALEEIVEGPNGILNGLSEKGIHISASTISVDLARKLSAAHAERKQYFVSATVLGRPDAAKAAKLRIILAGPEQARQQLIPVLEQLGREIFEIGDYSEEGNVVKIGVNFLIASMLEALSETQLMVEKYGIEPARFMDVVNALFQSPLYQNYGAIMTEQRFEPAGFKMKLGLKDVALAIEAAQSVQAPLPLGQLIHHHLSEGIARGYGEMDWTALIRCLEHSS